MKHAFFERYAELNSPVHRQSAAHKLSLAGILLLMVLILAPLLGPRANNQILVLAGGIMALLTWVSTVPLRFLLVRTTLILPFSGLVILVNAFSGTFETPQILLILARSLLSVFIILLLIFTTPFHEILTQLARWRFPKLVILIMAFMYRYFFLLTSEIDALQRGIQMRRPGLRGWRRIQVYANIIALLLIRSYERSERVYQAMRMRGFTGELP